MEKRIRVSNISLLSYIYKLDLKDGVAYIESLNIKGISIEPIGENVTVKVHNPKNNIITYVRFDSLDDDVSISGDNVAYYFVYEQSWKIAEMLNQKILAKIDKQITELKALRIENEYVKVLSPIK